MKKRKTTPTKEKAKVWKRTLKRHQKKKEYKPPVEVIVGYFPTHSIAIDIRLGGGIPKASQIEFLGNEDAGKTTSVCEIMAVNSWNSEPTLHHDLEGKLHPDRRKEIFAWYGVDSDKLDDDKDSVYLYERHAFAEGTKDTAIALANSGALSLYVVDSITALQSEKVVEAALQGKGVQKGMHAATVADLISPLVRLCFKHGGSVIYINQKREKIGGGGGKLAFGVTPTYGTGGRSLRYYSTLRFDITKGERIDSIKGWHVWFNIKKNHAGAGKTIRVPLTYNHRGLFLWREECLSFAMQVGVVEQTKKKGIPNTYKITLGGKKTKVMQYEEILDWIGKNRAFRVHVRKLALEEAGLEA